MAGDNGFYFTHAAVAQLKMNKKLRVITPNSINFYPFHLYISTWSYENRVSKHFVIFLNFCCLIACLLCCLLTSFVFFGLSSG